jgi:hypothetical protein
MNTELIVYKDYTSTNNFIYFINFNKFKIPIDLLDNSHLWGNRIIISSSTAIGKQVLSDNYHRLYLEEFPDIAFCLGQSPSNLKHMTKRQLHLKFLGNPRFLASTSQVFYRNFKWKYSTGAPWDLSRSSIFLFQSLPLDKWFVGKIIYDYLFRVKLRNCTLPEDLKIAERIFNLNECYE